MKTIWCTSENNEKHFFETKKRELLRDGLKIKAVQVSQPLPDASSFQNKGSCKEIVLNNHRCDLLFFVPLYQ